MHYTTICSTQSNAPEDGRDHRPKHVELIAIINKPLLLSLVFISFIKTVTLHKLRVTNHLSFMQPNSGRGLY